jgi:iron complex outermembrane receptor protein
MEQQMSLTEKQKKVFIWIVFILGVTGFQASAHDGEAEKAYDLGKIQVSADGSKNEILHTPSGTFINVDAYKSPGVVQNIGDILKDNAIIDLRGASDLVPEPDGIYMRGFESRSFVTAIDGLQFQKSGGYWGFHFVDYALIPVSMIDTIEIIPGPHCSRFPGQAVGGVINVRTKEPKHHDTPEIGGDIAASYKSYETIDTKVNINGGTGNFDFGLAWQDYSTDGYLRNNDADISSISGRFGYRLPSDGFISAMASFARKDTGWIVKNDPSQPDYDSDYPDVSATSTTAAQSPTREKRPQYFNLKYNQPTPVGLLNLTAYYYYDDQENHGKEASGRFKNGYPAGVYDWQTYGVKIQDEISLFKGNTLTVGYEHAHLEGDGDDKSGFNDIYVEDKWELRENLNLTLGARYENIDIHWSNWTSTSWALPEGKYKNPLISKKYIKKSYSHISPKSFLTYDLDALAKGLRDTSISLGVSELWSPRSGYCQV